MEKNVQMSLANFGLDYLDLFLIHWPVAYAEEAELFPRTADGKVITSEVDYLDTWKAMEKLVQKGLVKAIGVSNFNSEQLQRILDNCTVKPVVNQVAPVLERKWGTCTVYYSSPCTLLTLLYRRWSAMPTSTRAR